MATAFQAHPDIPLNGVDKSFFVIESDVHPMTVASGWLFDEPLELSDVLDQCMKLAQDFPRFRMRLSTPGGSLWPAKNRRWEAYEFVLADHITEMTLPETDGATPEEVLQSLMGELYSRPWDFSRSPWHTHIIHYGDGRTAMFIRVHHVVSDGQGFIRCLLSLTQNTTDAKAAQHGKHQAAPARLPLPSRLQPFTNVVSILPHFMQELLRLLALALALVWGLLQSVMRFSLILLTFKRHNLQGTLTPHKIVSFAHDIDLAQVKIVKDRYGVTVNDVLLSALAGSFRDAITHSEGELKDKDLLSYIPVSMRAHDDWALGNKVAAIWAYLPLDIEDPVARLKEVHTRMNVLKKSAEPAGTYFFTKMLGHFPLVQTRANRWFLRNLLMCKPHSIITNVPGPRQKLTFAGKTIQSYLIFAPQPGDGSVGVALISYADKISCSVVADSTLLPDRGAGITSGVAKHVQALLKTTQSVAA